MQKILSKEDRGLEWLQQVHASAGVTQYLLESENVRLLGEALACTPTPYLAIRLLHLVQKLGCQLKQNVYECICFQLTNAKHWYHISIVVALGMQQTGRTTCRLLNWKVRAVLETQRYNLLQSILGEFERYYLKPNRRTFHLMLSGHVRNCDMTQARICLQHMQDSGFPPDSSTHAILATNTRAFGLDKQIQSQALEGLRDMNDATSVAVVNSLIQLHLDIHDVLGALNLLSYFIPQSVEAVLTAMKDARHSPTDHRISRAHSVGPNSMRRQLTPNATTFAILLNYMASRGDLEGAIGIIHGMNQIGIKPNSAVVIAMVRVYSSTGCANVAIRLVASLCDQVQSPMSVFAPLMSPKMEGPNLHIDIVGIVPSVELFNALLKGVLPIHGLNAMRTILNIMCVNSISPNSATLEVFVSHLRKRENAHPRIIIRVLRQLFSDNLRPTIRHLHVILSCVVRYEKFLLYGSGWNVTAARFSATRHTEMQAYPERRISSSSTTLDPAAGLMLPHHLNYRALVRPIVEALTNSQVRSDAAMFALRIRHDAIVKSDVESADQIVHTLLSRGIHLTEYHYSALIEGYSLSGNFNRAEDLLASMEKAGMKLNVIIYTIMIVGYGRHGLPEKAVQLFQRMVAMGHHPDVPAIDALCAAFFAVGAYGTARKMLITCWAYIEPFPEENSNLPLKELATRFRALHAGIHSMPKSMTKQQQLWLHFRVRGLVKKWKFISSLTKHSHSLSTRLQRRRQRRI
ncbi:hypothetical protein AMATHDRAFT_72348 [Amanita thiersii Skay4041]|uniref:Pentacotripeptide-repeat region of PRORP domain-containing protein n=1 Tax=Amanita thiersii Skay4041 TaxID=703135 RepID=A0A2A9NUB8_9AGAR|nr:hypothetical protein AMATHDRAFT_72348 [Amanita thiersii Skay4041]